MGILDSLGGFGKKFMGGIEAVKEGFGNVFSFQEKKEEMYTKTIPVQAGGYNLRDSGLTTFGQPQVPQTDAQAIEMFSPPTYVEPVVNPYANAERQERFQTKYDQELKSNFVISADYKEPTTFIGSFVEGVKMGWQATIEPSIGYFVESLGEMVNDVSYLEGMGNALKGWGEEFGDRQTIDFLSRPELMRPEDLKPFFEGGALDSRWYGRTMGENLPYMFSLMGLSTLAGLGAAGAAVTVALATSFAGTVVLEQGSAYKRMIDEGVDPDRAAPASNAYGIISSVIEHAFGYNPAGLGEKIFKRGIFKAVMVPSYKNYLVKELPKIGVTVLRKMGEEGMEEVMQGVTENLFLNWLTGEGAIINKELAEQFAGGAAGSMGFGFAADFKVPVIRNVNTGKETIIPSKEVQFKMDEAFGDRSNYVTTRILEKLKDKKEVSYQYIDDLTKMKGLVKPEIDRVKEVLAEYKEGDMINATEFREKIEVSLLPLTANHGEMDSTTQEHLSGFMPIHDATRLIGAQRGTDVVTYMETIYQGTVPNRGGELHWGEIREDLWDKYFAHARAERLNVDGVKTLRDLEYQSDFMQKSGIASEQNMNLDTAMREGRIPILPVGDIVTVSGFHIGKKVDEYTVTGTIVDVSKDGSHYVIKPKDGESSGYSWKLIQDPRIQDAIKKERGDYSLLKPFEGNKRWIERIIRERIKFAIDNDYKVLLIPTGVTALKVEGMAGGINARRWTNQEGYLIRPGELVEGRIIGENIKEYLEEDWVDALEATMAMSDAERNSLAKRNYDRYVSRNSWIITDVYIEGRFKAAPLRILENLGVFTDSFMWNEGTKVEELVHKGVTYYFNRDTVDGRISWILDAYDSNRASVGNMEETIDKYLSTYRENFDINAREGIDVKSLPEWKKTIYDNYEKYTKKYLKGTRPDFQMFTDAAGIEWFKLTITNRDKLNPVYNYKEGVDSRILFNISFKEAEAILARFFDKNEVGLLMRNKLSVMKAGGRSVPAFGQYYNSLIEIVQKEGKVSDTVMYHEAFHAFVDLFVTKEQKAELFAYAENKYKNNADFKKSKARYKREYKAKGISDAMAETRATNKVINEYLADLFAGYQTNDVTLPEKIYRIFAKLTNDLLTIIGKENKVLRAFQDMEAKKRPDVITRRDAAEASAKEQYLHESNWREVFNEIIKPGTLSEDFEKGIKEYAEYLGIDVDSFESFTRMLIKYGRINSMSDRQVAIFANDFYETMEIAFSHYRHIVYDNYDKTDDAPVSKIHFESLDRFRKAISGLKNAKTRQERVFAIDKIVSTAHSQEGSSVLDWVLPMGDMDRVANFTKKTLDWLRNQTDYDVQGALYKEDPRLENLKGKLAELQKQIIAIMPGTPEHDELLKQSATIQQEIDILELTESEQEFILQAEAEQFIQEDKDEIDEIIAGNRKMQVPKELKSDWIETVGRGPYAKMFRVDDKLSTVDEVATDLGMNEDELMQEIASRIRAEENRIEVLIPEYIKKEIALVKQTEDYQGLSEELREEIHWAIRPARKNTSRVFSLLGNKDTTIPMFRRIFDQWVKDGVTTILEPYAGAFTLGTHSTKDAIKAGLKEFHSNIFDKEKYIIIKAIKEGKANQVKRAVDKSVKIINNTILRKALIEPKVQEVFNDFFKKHPGSFIGSNKWRGYIRLTQLGARMTMPDANKKEYAMFQGVFKAAFKELFAQKVVDIESATMRTVMSKIAVRGGMGQSLLLTNGFTAFEEKIYNNFGIIKGIDDTAETFKLAKKHKTKITLYSEDGPDEFIKRFNKLDASKVGYYIDPPYINSAKVYMKELKDAPQEVLDQLERFTSGKQVHKYHEDVYEMGKKGARIAMNNFIDQDYLAGFKSRINDAGIFAYKEGTTYTSLVTDPETTGIVKAYLAESLRVAIKGSAEISRKNEIKSEKGLNSQTIGQIKKAFKIKDWRTAKLDLLNSALDYMETLEYGDELLTDLQKEGMKDLLATYGDPMKKIGLITRREIREKFGEHRDLLTGRISRFIAPAIFPTVDIKQHHPILTRTFDRADHYLRIASRNVKKRSIEVNDLMTKAEQSEKKEGKKNTWIKIFEVMGGLKSIDLLTKEQTDVVKYLKDFFLTAKKEIALKKYRTHYIPHLQRSFMERVEEEGLKKAIISAMDPRSTDIPLDILLNMEHIIGTTKFFKFALERKGYGKPTMDIRRIVDTYSRIYEDKLALDKVLPEAYVAQKLLLQKKSTLFMDKFLKNLKGRGMDHTFRHSEMGWMAKTTDRIIDLGYIRFLAFNRMSTLKNIVAGEVNSFIWEGFENTLKGKARLLQHPRVAMKFISASGVLDGSYAELARSDMITKGKRMTDIILYGGMELGEFEIRGTYMLGQLTDQEWADVLADKKKPTDILPPKRFRQILDGIAITQGMYTKVDSPLFVQTWYGRMMMQFRRWMITDIMLVRRITKGAYADYKKGDYQSKNMMRMVRMLYTTGLMTWIAYGLGKKGYEEAEKVAKAGAELLYNIFNMFPPKFIHDAIANNPTIDTLASFVYTYEQLLYMIGVGREPYKVEINRGIEETYFKGLDLLGVYKKKKDKKSIDIGGIEIPSIKTKGIKLEGIKVPGIKLKL